MHALTDVLYYLAPFPYFIIGWHRRVYRADTTALYHLHFIRIHSGALLTGVTFTFSSCHHHIIRPAYRQRYLRYGAVEDTNVNCNISNLTMAVTSSPTPLQRRQILRTLFISLLLDLLSFTLILPLFPALLAHYQTLEAGYDQQTLLRRTFAQLNAFKAAFERPISSRFDVVLLGGALGSLFSLLQAIAAPIIGALSDRYGRRTALLYSMAGNLLSVLIWVFAVDFATFVASRVVGGLSEGNVQLAIAIATDVSGEGDRGAALALVGVAFSVAFTVGPMIGAVMAGRTVMARNPFAAAAGFSLVLIVVETVYLYFMLPETKPSSTSTATSSSTDADTATTEATTKEGKDDEEKEESLTLLSITHFLFLLVSRDNGKLLGFVGLTASLLQGSFTRRAAPHIVVKTGLLAAAAAFLRDGGDGTHGAGELACQ
ncbi:hypothetical protein ABW21_db0201187 [Orbilia brochopaga]|nr:hypothetical protein ABW21_db0201187 [Drechslerella brochopaga]